MSNCYFDEFVCRNCGKVTIIYDDDRKPDMMHGYCFFCGGTTEYVYTFGAYDF